MKTLEPYLASKTIEDLNSNFAVLSSEGVTIEKLKAMNLPTPGALAYRLTH
jgi:hypothetical protein